MDVKKTKGKPMISKLKCPFCNKNLILSYITDDFCCEECWESATEKVWQALIQARQDLEIARKALVFVKALNERQDGCFEEDYETQMRTVYEVLETIGKHNE